MIVLFVRHSVHNGPMVSYATPSHRSTQAMSFSPNLHPPLLQTERTPCAHTAPALLIAILAGRYPELKKGED